MSERTGLMAGVELQGQIPCVNEQEGDEEDEEVEMTLVPGSNNELVVADEDAPQLTFRAVMGGLGVGSVLCFTNMYFGLQTGWVTMGSIQAAVVGFAIFKLCIPGVVPFGPLENVVLQTVSVATATMPLAGGFIGIIPALGMLDPPVR